MPIFTRTTASSSSFSDSASRPRAPASHRAELRRNLLKLILRLAPDRSLAPSHSTHGKEGVSQVPADRPIAVRNLSPILPQCPANPLQE